ncbi:Clp protease N-terminal domain-containing protein [Pseudonocardia pini]|uniref:Clp protease N-terminal domain-containing protein n=1 Tax=Pseudonocardia pini TaxID=2758030 RepID=UPI0015F07DBB|nr:Clp protease N-terminal domain-containing protein [Pseudonocardia pini]
MPKINVYLPDDLAAAVKEAGIPVSSVCQQALAEAVAGAPSAGGAAMDDSETPGWNRFTARARTAVRAAVAHDRPTTTDLLAAVVDEGDNLALTILATLDVEPPDLLAEARGLPGATDLASALERSTTEALRLQHNYIGCEHLLLGLATGPADDAVVVAMRSVGLDRDRLRTAVGAAVAGVAFTRTQQASAGLTAPLRTILEDIRTRLTRLETR